MKVCAILSYFHSSHRDIATHFKALNYEGYTSFVPFLIVHVCVCVYILGQMWVFVSRCRFSGSCHGVKGLGAFTAALYNIPIVLCGSVCRGPIGEGFS